MKIEFIILTKLKLLSINSQVLIRNNKIKEYIYIYSYI